MNSIIKELAERAGFQYVKDEGIGWAGNYNSSLPKFAELIVLECAKICDEEALDEYAQRKLEYCSYAIKEHFGVE